MRIPFRARIGVTGHRCIRNLAEVEAAIPEALQEVHRVFAPTQSTDVVFSILSSLAVGADRLIVKAALDGVPAAELGAILPVAQASYEQDFKSKEAREEFHQLLSRAKAKIELEHHHIPEGEGRDAAYARAGHYIVEHSDVLIALWDGREARGTGGTEEIVEYAEKRGVWVVIVPTVGPRNEAPLARKLRLRLRDRKRRRSAGTGLRRINHYNQLLADSTQVSEKLRSGGSEKPRSGVSKKLRSERDRIDSMLEQGSSLQQEGLRVADWALPRQLLADRLAVSNHRLQTLLAWAIHLLAALAVMAVAIQTLYHPHRSGWLVVEVVLVLFLLLAVLFGRIVRFRDRWSGYRSLTEAVRSSLFIALCDIDDKRNAEHTNIFGDPEEAWFQRAFTQIWQSRPQVHLRRDDAAALRTLLVEDWIQGQIEYHERTARRAWRLNNLCTLLMGAIALATIVVALLHISALSAKRPSEGTLKLAALVLPAFGGAAAGLREYGQLRLHQERSERAATRLRGLGDRMAAASTLTSIRHLAAEAQRIMVDETVDWYGVSEFQDVNIVL
jgi:hypothetical protein